MNDGAEIGGGVFSGTGWDLKVGVSKGFCKTCLGGEKKIVGVVEYKISEFCDFLVKHFKVVESFYFCS